MKTAERTRKKKNGGQEAAKEIFLNTKWGKIEINKQTKKNYTSISGEGERESSVLMMMMMLVKMMRWR